MWRDAANVNALWGALIVEELVRNGVDHFVVCPGSRSTPLVQAIARHPATTTTLWIDERGAAFHALGHARGGVWPVGVVTTSGTAVANLLPAVVEASLDGVPLILLTADRPHELREVGANQSIRQTGLFSDHVRWSFDLPVPDTAMPARALLSTVDHAVHRAVDGHEGPVQLNCPFREPLAPTPAPWDAAWLEPLAAWERGQDALVSVSAGEAMDWALLEAFAADVAAAKSGLLVCGALPGVSAASEAAALAEALDWPLWTDVRSGLRLGPGSPRRRLHLDRVLAREGAGQPDVVIQLGARLTSRRMQQVLGAGHAAHYALVDPEPSRLDPTHAATERFVCEIDEWCAALRDLVDDAGPSECDGHHEEALVAAAIEAAVEEGGALSEPWVARWLTRNMDPSHGLFVSNSMPIRDVQDYGAADGPALAVAANRGASGIDGIVSTAAGFAQGLDAPTTLLVGDLAFLHDVNALAMLEPLEQPLTIVLLNNGGGSIFSFLPIAEHEDVLDPYITTPHDLQFEGACRFAGIAYARVETRAAFEEAYQASLSSGAHGVIEVVSSLAGNRDEHLRIEAAVEKALE